MTLPDDDLDPRGNPLDQSQIAAALDTYVRLCRTTTWTEAGDFIRHLSALDPSAPKRIHGMLKQADINPSEVPLYQGLIDSL